MASTGEDAGAPLGATSAVLKASEPVPEGATPVRGIDFDHYGGRNISAAELVDGMADMGFQASSVGKAAKIINGMVVLTIAMITIETQLITVCREHGAMKSLDKARPYSLAILPT